MSATFFANPQDDNKKKKERKHRPHIGDYIAHIGFLSWNGFKCIYTPTFVLYALFQRLRCRAPRNVGTVNIPGMFLFSSRFSAATPLVACCTSITMSPVKHKQVSSGVMTRPAEPHGLGRIGLRPTRPDPIRPDPTREQPDYCKATDCLVN